MPLYIHPTFSTTTLATDLRMVLIVDVPIAERLNGEGRWPVVTLVTSAAIAVMVIGTTNNTYSAPIAPSTGKLLPDVSVAQSIRIDHPNVGIRGTSHARLLFVQRRWVQRYRRWYTVEQFGRFDLIHRWLRHHHAVAIRGHVQSVAVGYHSIQRSM